jgi:hypothetical protein
MTNSFGDNPLSLIDNISNILKNQSFSALELQGFQGKYFNNSFVLWREFRKILTATHSILYG